ncbi:unnamed protein product [Microthlaspi erraticum]|uniref:Uncharacterized protein n=1 Tax=Microthlaspi erraticum TaxID=1685480 RepID=A0A6D2J909_9BRAS|nr:unnamed protein product [Microthlaspi erraticum]
MADDLLLQEGEGANRSHHSDSPSPNEDKVIDGVDFISSLPDPILHVILSSIPTKFAIRTSALSTRWRHVWCGTPTLSIDFLKRKRDAIMETLTRHYSAPRIISSNLCISDDVNSGQGVCLCSFVLPATTKSQVDSFIELGMAEMMFLAFRDPCFKNYEFPDLFYTNSSLKLLSVNTGNIVTVPTVVSWTSLRILYLNFCKLSDASFAKILSGSPLLESLALFYCLDLEHLDLSGSLKLRRLAIDTLGPMQIVAPHVHCLTLNHTHHKCDLVTVSSLTEASVDITCTELEVFCTSDSGTDLVLLMIVDMLEKLKNAKKLTFGAIFLQILSLAEACDVPFPTLKVEVLTLKTVIAASVIPGIAKLLQNSPSLKKVKLDMVQRFIFIIPVYN